MQRQGAGERWEWGAGGSGRYSCKNPSGESMLRSGLAVSWGTDTHPLQTIILICNVRCSIYLEGLSCLSISCLIQKL